MKRVHIAIGVANIIRHFAFLVLPPKLCSWEANLNDYVLAGRTINNS